MFLFLFLFIVSGMSYNVNKLLDDRMESISKQVARVKSGCSQDEQFQMLNLLNVVNEDVHLEADIICSHQKTNGVHFNWKTNTLSLSVEFFDEYSIPYLNEVLTKSEVQIVKISPVMRYMRGGMVEALAGFDFAHHGKEPPKRLSIETFYAMLDERGLYVLGTHDEEAKEKGRDVVAEMEKDIREKFAHWEYTTVTFGTDSAFVFKLFHIGDDAVKTEPEPEVKPEPEPEVKPKSKRKREPESEAEAPKKTHKFKD